MDSNPICGEINTHKNGLNRGRNMEKVGVIETENTTKFGMGVMVHDSLPIMTCWR